MTSKYTEEQVEQLLDYVNNILQPNNLPERVQGLELTSPVPTGVGTNLEGITTFEDLRSKNFVPGATGCGINGPSGDAEFNNITARGAMRAMLMEYQQKIIQCGTEFRTKKAGGKIRTEVTSVVGTDFDVEVEDMEYGHYQTSVIGDIWYVHNGSENWWTVTAVTDKTTYWTYTVTLSYGSAVLFKKGQPFANFGQAGDGYLMMTADATGAPFYSVRKHSGTPWSSVTELARFGNLNGFLNFAVDTFGFGAGDSTRYLTYDPINGIQEKGSVSLSGTDGDKLSITGLGYAITQTATSGGETRTGQLGLEAIPGTTEPVWCMRYFDPNSTDMIGTALDGDMEHTTQTDHWDFSNDWGSLGFGSWPSGYGTVLDIIVSGTDLYIASGLYIYKYDTTTKGITTIGTANSTVLKLLIVSGILYATGGFTTIDGVSATRIAQYNISTSTWTAMGGGINSGGRSLTNIGTDLYVGGVFTQVDGSIAANYIAKWDGSWHAIHGTNSPTDTVNCLETDGTYIYAGDNDFNFCKYDPSAGTWTKKTASSTILCMKYDGSTYIYVGGNFTTIDSVSASKVAKYAVGTSTFTAIDASAISAQVNAIAISGSDIIFGGDFTTVGGVSMAKIAKWNGAWSALNPASALGNDVWSLAFVSTMLYVGGSFTSANSATDTNRIARYGNLWKRSTTNPYAGVRCSTYEGSTGGTQKSKAYIASVTAGKTYSFTVYGMTRTGTVSVEWFDSTPTSKGTATPITVTTVGAYTQFSGNAVAPTGTTQAKVTVTATGNAGTLYIDNLSMTELSLANLYFKDGNLITDMPFTCTGLTMSAGTFAPTGIWDFWVGAGETWVYVSASSYKVVGVDLTSKYQIGDKIRFKQGGAYKYCYLTAVAMSGSDTLFTVVLETAATTVANATITDNYYSRADRPMGFPKYFTWTPTYSSESGSLTTMTTNLATYTIRGGFIKMDVDVTIANKGTGAGNLYYTPPTNLSVAYMAGSGREAVSKKQLQTFVNSATSVGIALYDGTTCIATNNRALTSSEGLLA